MTPKISALIIDSKKSEHDYSKVNTKDIVYLGDPAFDLTVVENTDNVFSEINKHKIIDSIVTIGCSCDIERHYIHVYGEHKQG